MAAHLLGRAAKEPAPDAGVAAVTDDDQVGALVLGGPHDLLGGMAGADVGPHRYGALGRIDRRLLKQLGAGLFLGDRQGLLMRAAGVAAAVAVMAILAWLSTRSNLRPARSARWLQAGSVWLGHPGGGRRGGDRS